jgi:hypothetical protein
MIEQQTQQLPLLYQALGIIKGSIEKIDNKYFIDLGTQKYLIRFLRKSKKMFKLIDGYVENKQVIDFKVYPQYNLHTKKIFFTVVCFWDNPPAENESLGNVFFLSGIWQKIPQEDKTVFSIYRNRKIHEEDWCRTIHLPISWANKDRNPFVARKKKTEYKPTFSRIVAILNPDKKIFEHVKTLDDGLLPPKKIQRAKRKINKINPKKPIEVGRRHFKGIEKMPAKPANKTLFSQLPSNKRPILKSRGN